MTVHVLLYGLPLCNFTTEAPAFWPAGDRWVYLGEAAKANCPGCIETADGIGEAGDGAKP